ncbi:MAG: ABC transporter permease, partial [Bacteroidota bacterium]|nr:ABC transporter permease [Bacteroidota bacterium]
MFKNYFKTTIRNFWKNRGYSSLNIFGLAIGICCAGLILLWIEDEVTYDHQNTKIDQLYQVMENQSYEGKTYTFAATPGLLGPSMKKEFPEVGNTCRTTWDQYTLFSLGEKTIYEVGYFADSSLLDMFTVPLLEGRKEGILRQAHSLVISERMAKKFFGNSRDIVGRTLMMDNKDPYTITGVMQDLPENSSLQYDWLAPFNTFLDKNSWLLNWGNNGIQTFVELKAQASAGSADKKLFGYIGSKDTTAIAKPFLNSMNDWRLRSKFDEGKRAGGRIEYVRMFSIIGWIILLIACINFMNLATARSEKRAREVGVRKVLGAVKGLLIRQFIVESIFMAFVSVFIAVLMIYLLISPFNTLVDKHMTVRLGDPAHFGALLALGLVCGLVAGSYPAFYLSSFNPSLVLKGLKTRGNSAAVVRKGLVVVQFTISIVLIVCTIIIYQQIQHVKNRNLGYNRQDLVYLNLRGDMKKHFNVIKNDL